MSYIDNEFATPELNGALALSTTFNGSTYDNFGSPTSFREFGGLFSSDVASASNGAKIQASFDGGATWKDVVVATLAAGVPQILTAPIVSRYMRLALVNAGVAATAALVVSFRRRH